MLLRIQENTNQEILIQYAVNHILEVFIFFSQSVNHDIVVIRIFLIDFIFLDTYFWDFKSIFDP